MKFLYRSLFISILFLNACVDSAPDIEEPPELFFSGLQSGITGDFFSFFIEAKDPQGVGVQLIVEGLPDWLTFSPADASLTGTPAAGDEGLYIISVTADNGERARSRDLRIRVYSNQEEKMFQNGVENAISSFASGLQGISVAAIDRHENVYHAFTGTFNSGNDLFYIDQNSLFRVASVSKPVTTALLLQLVDEGEFQLDDKLSDLIDSELPNSSQMTIRQMLSHTAGVYDHLNSGSFWSSPLFTPIKVWSADEIVGFAVDNGPVFIPGSAYGYSNTAFYQFKTLIEEVTGLPLKKAYRERVLEPLGLKATYFDNFSTSSNPIDGLALNQRSYEYHLTAAGPAGAIASTAADMAHFGRKLYGGNLLSAELTDQLSVNIGGKHNGPGYGLGTRIWNIGGISHHGHTGALLGYRNILMYVPEADLTISIHTNDVHSNWFTLVDAIFDYSVQNFSDGLAKPVPFNYGELPRKEINQNR